MKALASALQLLLEFTQEQPDFSVGELAQRTGLHKSRISKLLATFRAHGFLAQDPQSRRYSVGVRAFALGSRFVNSHRLSREALPILRALVDRTQQSARLSVLEGTDVLYLLGIEGTMFYDAGWRVGTALPFHATSAGKVLAAFVDEATLAKLIAEKGLEKRTPQTIADEPTLRRALRQIRERGFASAREELTPGLGAIAVPLFCDGNKIIGALSLAFPAHLVSQSKETEYVRILHAEARKLSVRMGSQVYPYGGQLVEPAAKSALAARQRPPGRARA